VNKHI